MLGSHVLPHDLPTWGVAGIVQEPSPFPIPIFVIVRQQRGKTNGANDM